ncbi:Uncharacterised protein [uncultured Collinsella sp.]|nr:Uncharacterised protein [uncultured Collinsella sp.]
MDTTMIVSVDDVRLAVPADFRPMNSDEISGHYGSFKLNEAFIQDADRAYLAIQFGEQALGQDGVTQRIDECERVYRRMSPGFVMGEKRLYTGGDAETAALSFKSNALDRDLLNMLAISSMAGKELFLLLTCNIEDAQRYIPIFTAMVESLRLESTDC